MRPTHARQLWLLRNGKIIRYTNSSTTYPLLLYKDFTSVLQWWHDANNPNKQTSRLLKSSTSDVCKRVPSPMHVDAACCRPSWHHMPGLTSGQLDTAEPQSSADKHTSLLEHTSLLQGNTLEQWSVCALALKEAHLTCSWRLSGQQPSHNIRSASCTNPLAKRHKLKLQCSSGK